MYTTPILAHAPTVPSSISRNTGINIAPSPTLFIYTNINNHYSADLHNIYIGVNILAIRDKYWYVYYTDKVNASMTVSEVCELKHKTN